MRHNLAWRVSIRYDTIFKVIFKATWAKCATYRMNGVTVYLFTPQLSLVVIILILPIQRDGQAELVNLGD